MVKVENRSDGSSTCGSNSNSKSTSSVRAAVGVVIMVEVTVIILFVAEIIFGNSVSELH